jgi:hypothetical protein|nr:MAG TPA: hypothetical protein [Caudoviricetes sp.]
MEEYIVFSTRRANQLIQRGCNFLRTAKDAKNPKFNIYIFEDTPSFRKIYDEVATENRDRKK